ncbi:MAG: glycine cleavage system aminomethyltransferase GcvT [Pseudomonadota bacterium]
MSILKRTPLHDLHQELGAKLVDFAGWDMPVQYAGIMAEHKACREACALFDVSHMGQVELRGENVAEKLEALAPQALTTLPEGKARYAFFTNDQGGVLDDLIISNAGDHVFVVVNASMRDQDLAHMRAHLDGVEVAEITDHALIALQGPKAGDVLGGHCSKAATLRFMETTMADIAGHWCRISRLGYTGEDGFEIAVPEGGAEALARLFLDHPDCAPAGLGARDSLRMEAGLCLYGSDLDQTTTPIEADLVWAIQKRRREDGGFPGDKIIMEQITNGTSRKLVGIRPDGRAPARGGTEILDMDGHAIGIITSGGFGPTVGAPVAMGYVSSNVAKVGTPVQLRIRGKEHAAKVAEMPFVPQNYKR